MKVIRKIIQIDEDLCDGCGDCVPSCAEGAIDIRDGKARLVADRYCDGLGACLGECPNGALHIVERESEEFDEEAVEEHLSELKQAAPSEQPLPVAGCPSAKPVFLDAPGARAQAAESAPSPGGSCLANWPVQIRLVPPTAPFLKGAELLVTADCVPVTVANFHQDFLKGKVVLMGCPKFDNIQETIQRLTEIFKKAGIRSVTVLDMEVPCCSALPVAVRKAMTAAGKQIPMEEILIGRHGNILKKETYAA